MWLPISKLVRGSSPPSAAGNVASVLAGDPASVLETLDGLLEDGDPSVRASGAYALGRFGEAAAPAVDRLIALLDDPDPSTRAQAAAALGGIGAPASAAIEVLRARERDEDLRVSSAARQAVARLRTPTRSR